MLPIDGSSSSINRASSRLPTCAWLTYPRFGESPASALNSAASIRGCALPPNSANRFCRPESGPSPASRECSRLPREADSDIWRESAPKPGPPGRGDAPCSVAGMLSFDDDEVSWMLSGRMRRGGGIGGVGVEGCWWRLFERPSLALPGEMGEPPSSGIGLNCTGGFRSGCVGGGGERSRRTGEIRWRSGELLVARARKGLWSMRVSGAPKGGEACMTVRLPVEPLTEGGPDSARPELRRRGSGGCERLRSRLEPCPTAGGAFVGLILRVRTLEPEATDEDDDLTTCNTRSFSSCSSAFRVSDATLLA